MTLPLALTGALAACVVAYGMLGTSKQSNTPSPKRFQITDEKEAKTLTHALPVPSPAVEAANGDLSWNGDQVRAELDAIENQLNELSVSIAQEPAFTDQPTFRGETDARE